MGASKSVLRYTSDEAVVVQPAPAASPVRRGLPPSVDLRACCALSEACLSTTPASAAFTVAAAHGLLAALRNDEPPLLPSRRHILRRMIAEHPEVERDGDNAHWACDALNRGVCDETRWPWESAAAPDDACDEEGGDRLGAADHLPLYELALYALAHDALQLKAWIAKQRCVLCVIRVGDSAMEDGVWTGEDEWLGMACVLLVGYNDYDATFLAQVPWRAGRRSFIALPMAYVCNPRFATELLGAELRQPVTAPLFV